MFTLIVFAPLILWFGSDKIKDKPCLLKTIAIIFAIAFFVVMVLIYLTEGLLSGLISLICLPVYLLLFYAYGWPAILFLGVYLPYSDLFLLYLLLSWNPILAIFPISMAICLWILKTDLDKSLSILLFSTFILWISGSYAYFAYERPTIENDAIALLFNTYETYEDALTTNEK